MSKAERQSVYTISVASELVGMHPQTLRNYEKKGLIDPFRSAGGQRKYSPRDIARLKQIDDLTDSGLNLEGVKRVLDSADRVQKLETTIRRLNHKIDRMKRLHTRELEELKKSFASEIEVYHPSLPARRKRK